MNPIDVISKISVSKIINYLGDIFFFYISPKKFFCSLNSKSSEDKFSQIIFYILLYTSLYLIFDEKQNFYSVIKWLIIDIIVYYIFSIFILLLSSTITSYIAKTPRISFTDILIFNLLLLIFFELQ